MAGLSEAPTSLPPASTDSGVQSPAIEVCSVSYTHLDVYKRQTQGGVAQERINELECVDDAVYANVWQTDRILRIDPRTGAVTAEIDAAGLLTAEERAAADVLNGIAYDPEGCLLYTSRKRRTPGPPG